MKRYDLHSASMVRDMEGDYVEAAPALAWKRYALALLDHASFSSYHSGFSESVEDEVDAAHAELVKLGEVEP
jgi:hypothetical protein